MDQGGDLAAVDLDNSGEFLALGQGQADAFGNHVDHAELPVALTHAPDQLHHPAALLGNTALHHDVAFASAIGRLNIKAGDLGAGNF